MGVAALIWMGGLAAGACNAEEPTEGMSGTLGTPSSAGDEDSGHEPEPCDEGCVHPPSECHAPSGTCEDGFCQYAPMLAGEVCDEGCEGGGFCDAMGNCICTTNACDVTCTAGPNATAVCEANGECTRACEPPWENCDGDWSNGCEVPVGVTGVCDAGGLTADGGCWTAFCGESQAAEAHNFEHYYCVSCSTCNVPAEGMCRWCNRDTGNWYAADACSCGEHEDLACMP